MRALLASPLGFLVGLALGALGGGGSILAVPALVHGAGQSPSTATTASLVVVGASALACLPSHWRAGRVRLAPGLTFGLVGIGGNVLGSALNRRSDPDLLLLVFSGVMALAAAAMWRRDPGDRPPVGPTRGALDPVAVVRLVAAGTGVGFLTGSFGVGGGFVVVPALVLLLGFPMPEAVGTSLVVIFLNAVVALGLRAGTLDIPWGDVLPFLVMAAAGSVVGRRVASRLPPLLLTRGFAVLLLVLAVATAVPSLVALT